MATYERTRATRAGAGEHNFKSFFLWLNAGEGGGGRSTSRSEGAAACERFGSGGLGGPRWGVVAAGGWERGARARRALHRCKLETHIIIVRILQYFVVLSLIHI